MNINSGIETDIIHPKLHHGAYEWWYFDGMDTESELTWVLIFYEGNPFSPWYTQDPQSRAEDFPAVTLTIYHHGEPVYYSFVDYDREDVAFSENLPEWNIGKHSLRFKQKDGKWIFHLVIEDELPSGDRLSAEFEYISLPFHQSLRNGSANKNVGHEWTLVQPHATVRAEINLFDALDSQERNWKVDGVGYHDHNVGQEPMRDEFSDWYWGRLHFDRATLLYYVMHRNEIEQHQAWLISRDHQEIIDTLEAVELEDYSTSRFLLSSARKLKLKFADHEAFIQQQPVLDSGPFYQRFLTSGIVTKTGGVPDTAIGMSEYIKPGRIERRTFHPLVKMRLYNRSKGAHWVQKSPRLYRWTW
jgi:carotenoid 1,2-hydratase